MAATKLRDLQKLNQSIRSLFQKQIEDRECGFDRFVVKFSYEQGAKATPQQQRNLANVYKAFSHCISLLGEHGGVCAPLEDLVSALFEFRFQQHSESVGTAFTQLLCNLVSANNIFLRPALDMLAKNFLPIPKGQMYRDTPATSDAPATDSTDPGVVSPSETDHEGDYTLVHETLKQLLSQTPIAIGHLLTALQRHFPHKSRKAREQHDFVANLIAVADYAKAVAEKITILIVRKLIAIDVEIRLNYEPDCPDLTDADDADDDAATTSANPATSSAPATPSTISASATPATPATSEQPKTKLTSDEKREHELADKLDTTMLLMFKYIQRTCETPKGCKAMASTFMHIFRRAVLLTHKSKYTQFLIFYLTHFDKAFPDLFVKQMLDCLTDPEAAAISKQSSVAYCASYISRANFLQESTILSVLNFLLSWAFDWAGAHANDFPSRLKHQMFYTVCQAALYICCFRAVQLAQTARGAKFLKKWKWRQLLSCTLDPMQFCLESVRREFPKAMMRALNLRLSCKALDIGMVKDANNESSENASGGLGRGSNPLDSFFPFDPYLLFQSSAFVHKLYVSWTPIEAPPGMEDDEIFAKPMAHMDSADSCTSSSEDDCSIEDEEDEDMDTDTDTTGMDIFHSSSLGIPVPKVYPERNRRDSFEVMDLQPRRLRCNSFEELSRGTESDEDDASPSLMTRCDEVEHMIVEATD